LINKEVHVVVSSNQLKEVDSIKGKLKKVLKGKFRITHSIFEFEQQRDKVAKRMTRKLHQSRFRN
jgi:hypothetical protein